MYVYRVLHRKTKHGPYRNEAPPHRKRGRYDWWCEGGEARDDSRTPQAKLWPHEIPKGALFGFKDIEQVARWFTSHELALLVAEGFVVAKVKAERIVYEDYAQVIFIPRNKRLVVR